MRIKGFWTSSDEISTEDAAVLLEAVKKNYRMKCSSSMFGPGYLPSDLGQKVMWCLDTAS